MGLDYILYDSTTNERYRLPVESQDGNETLDFRKSVENRVVPGAERAFVSGDREWESVVIGIQFALIGQDARSAQGKSQTIREKVLAATSLLREVTDDVLATESQEILLTESGEELGATVGTARALLGPREVRIRQERGVSHIFWVSLSFNSKFGMATVAVAETEAEYDAAQKRPW